MRKQSIKVVSAVGLALSTIIVLTSTTQTYFEKVPVLLKKNRLSSTRDGLVRGGSRDHRYSSSFHDDNNSNDNNNNNLRLLGGGGGGSGDYHHHVIPNNIFLTHRIDFTKVVFSFQEDDEVLYRTSQGSRRTTKQLTYEQKELLALQRNVRNIFSMHPGTNIRFLTDSDCEDSVRNAMKQILQTNHTILKNRWNDFRRNTTSRRSAEDLMAEEFVQYFKNETVGMFKADLCRGTALYEHGGVYFDVDLGVRTNIWTILRPSTTFATVRTAPEFGHWNAFFQAFMASTRHNRIMQRYVELFYLHYAGTFSNASNNTFYSLALGCYLLKQAHKEILFEQEEQVAQSQHNLLPHSTISNQSSSTLRSTTINPTNLHSDTTINETIELWQETFYAKEMQQDVLKHVPYPKWGNDALPCKFIVVTENISPKTSSSTDSTAVSKKEIQNSLEKEVNHETTAVVPFYSRIEGSRVCPPYKPTRWEQFLSFFRMHR